MTVDVPTIIRYASRPQQAQIEQVPCNCPIWQEHSFAVWMIWTEYYFFIPVIHITLANYLLFPIFIQFDLGTAFSEMVEDVDVSWLIKRIIRINNEFWKSRLEQMT